MVDPEFAAFINERSGLDCPPIHSWPQKLMHHKAWEESGRAAAAMGQAGLWTYAFRLWASDCEQARRAFRAARHKKWVEEHEGALNMIVERRVLKGGRQGSTRPTHPTLWPFPGEVMEYVTVTLRFRANSADLCPETRLALELTGGAPPFSIAARKAEGVRMQLEGCIDDAAVQSWLLMSQAAVSATLAEVLRAAPRQFTSVDTAPREVDHLHGRNDGNVVDSLATAAEMLFPVEVDHPATAPREVDHLHGRNDGNVVDSLATAAEMLFPAEAKVKLIDECVWDELRRIYDFERTAGSNKRKTPVPFPRTAAFTRLNGVKAKRNFLESDSDEEREQLRTVLKNSLQDSARSEPPKVATAE
jgi:hypothetical protein